MNDKSKTGTESPANRARLRRCLLCGDNFPSDGPHNRICKGCKSRQVWRQG
ncbi:MAG: hypothetical protein IID48_10675 [Proteobacteria bacterium]|nr:hypothetical protein [Pseudomonadota bacterium]